MTKIVLKQLLAVALCICWLSCNSSKKVVQADTQSILPAKTALATAQSMYDKSEYNIRMRDGVRLYTAVYVPKDASPENTYPILMKRTPYSCRPYGPTAYRDSIGPSRYLMEDKYIFVYQDVRGRWMSEGSYDNMRPHIPEKQSNKDIDESSDTYDTIEWLLKNVANNNGRVGQWGISYPGFYTTTGTICGHPALVASSPQAPIADFYFDDFHHRGAYFLSYFMATTVFGYQKEGPTTESWYPLIDAGTPDQYRFFLEMGPLKNGDKYYGKDNFFWQQLKEHPDYDEFWQKRNILPHLKGIKHAVMTVGGWFDAEDLYGPLMTYKTIEKNNPGINNSLVMGPWSHGDWSKNRPEQNIGAVHFGKKISDFYQQEIEFRFFKHHLKGWDDTGLPEAYLFNTGSKEWEKFAKWPPANVQKKKLYLQVDQELGFDAPKAKDSFSEYISDPAKPVPYSEDIKVVFTPRKYMTDDQRFAGRRPDVLVFETPPLTEAVTVSGEIMARLKVSTSGTDADWVVKLIDVYPGDHPDYAHNPPNIRMGHYEQMVRSEVLRGRYRNDFNKPEPFTPGQITDVELPLQDVLHTFKKGHRIMIQIQSSWFPLIDRNPQKFVDNIFYADEADFIKATHRVYHSAEHTSHIELSLR
ncbi:MAG: CocE/NonD family hydrolase [Bacteroidota bacterium]